MQGMGYVETARRVNIDRRTLYRWVNQDPEFHKALESWRAVAVRSAEDRLLRGIELAATRLSYAAARDYRAASILLKGRGLLPGVAPAPPPAAPAARAERDPETLPPTMSPARKDEFYARLSELWHTFIFNDPPARDPGPPADETVLRRGRATTATASSSAKQGTPLRRNQHGTQPNCKLPFRPADRTLQSDPSPAPRIERASGVREGTARPTGTRLRGLPHW